MALVLLLSQLLLQLLYHPLFVQRLNLLLVRTVLELVLLLLVEDTYAIILNYSPSILWLVIWVRVINARICRGWLLGPLVGAAVAFQLAILVAHRRLQLVPQLLKLGHAAATTQCQVAATRPLDINLAVRLNPGSHLP